MNLAKVNTTWTRWIDNRPIDDQMIGDVMETDPGIRQQFADDLMVHRQLTEFARSGSSDDQFVNAMLSSFDQTQLAIIDPPNVIPNAESANATFDDVGHLETDHFDSDRPDHLVNRHHANPIVIVADPVDRRADHSPAGYRTMGLALLGVFLLAAVSVGAYQLGRSVSTQASLESTDSNSTNQGFVVAKDQPPANGAIENVGDGNLAGKGKAASKPIDKRDGQAFDRQPDGVVENQKEVVTKQKTDPAIELDAPKKNEQVAEEVIRPRNRIAKQDERPFATVTELEPCEWGFGPSEDGRIASRILELNSGKVEIKFDDRNTLVVSGPARLEVAGKSKVGLLSGDIEFNVSIGTLAIETPNATVDALSGSKFTYQLRKNGDTKMNLVDGTVHVTPWFGQLRGVRPSMLSDNSDFNQLEIEGRQPAIARFTSSENDRSYKALVNVNGRVLQTDNKSFAEDSFDTARQRLAADPGAVDEVWAGILGQLQSGMFNDIPFGDEVNESFDFRGGMFNGQPFGVPGNQLQTPAEMNEMFEKMREEIRKQMESGQPMFPPFGNGGMDFEFEKFFNDQQKQFPGGGGG